MCSHFVVWEETPNQTVRFLPPSPPPTQLPKNPIGADEFEIDGKSLWERALTQVMRATAKKKKNMRNESEERW